MRQALWIRSICADDEQFCRFLCGFPVFLVEESGKCDLFSIWRPVRMLVFPLRVMCEPAPAGTVIAADVKIITDTKNEFRIDDTCHCGETQQTATEEKESDV